MKLLPLLALAIMFPVAVHAQEPLPQSLDPQEPEAADIPYAPGPATMGQFPGQAPSVSMQPVIEQPQQPAAAPAAPAEEIPPEQMPAFDNDETAWKEQPIAKLQGLNKITAKTSVINVKLGEKVKFGNLDITATKCLRKENSEKNEAVALLEIWDEIPGQTRNKSFYGWMFSSSPAISALEHPIYDVIVLDCISAVKKKAEPKEDDKKDVKKEDGKTKQDAKKEPARKAVEGKKQ